MFRNVHLYGPLADKYGALHTFAINTAPEGVRGIAANHKGFTDDFRKGHYKIIVGDQETGLALDESMLRFRLGKIRDVHIIPVAEGSKGNHSGLKIIAGLAILTAVGFATGGFGLLAAGAPIGGVVGPTTVGAGVSAALGASPFAGIPVLGSITYGNIASIGFSLLVGGVANALAPIQSRGTDGSFIFNGAFNTSQEGSPMQLVYGRYQVGSLIISAGLDIVQNPPSQPSPPTL